MREWQIDGSEIVFRHRILDLERRRLEAGDDQRDVLVVNAPGWINVVPLTEDGRVVMVRQWRYGIQAPTLEIPGGMIDPGEDDRTAAGRELIEETGMRAGTLEQIGSMHPNPAFIANRLTTWLASDLEVLEEGQERFGVEGEEIERELVPLDEVPERIRSGEISHALVIAAFYLFGAMR